MSIMCGELEVTTDEGISSRLFGKSLHSIISAICKVCKTKTFNILESFPNMMDIIPGDEDSGEIKINDQMDIYPCDIDSDGRYLEHKFSVVEQNQPTNKYMQSEYMTAKEENDMISEDEASIWISQSDSENYMVYLPSSQISSWSTENDIQRNTLEEINSALNIIGEGKISPITYQIRKDVNELKPRTVRSLKRKASATVHEALDCLAPFQANKVWQLIDMDLCSTPSPKVDELVVQLFKESTDKCTKKQFLSMISLSYTKQQLRDIFPGISIYEIDQARMHAKTCGKGVPPPNKEKCVRQKMNKDKLDHALDFFLNPSFHQVTSVGTKQMHLRNGEVITIPQVVRTACPSTLVTIYQSFCQETDFSPLSRATLFKILAACPASKRTNLKGLDNVAADGALGFETLLSTLASIERYVSDNDKLIQLKECRENLLAAKLYLKTDFKAHIKQKDKCADHCISFALSDPMDQKHQQLCSDHIHDTSCDRCDLFTNTVLEVKNQIRNLGDELPPDLLSDIYGDIESACGRITDWKRHILRTINQDKGRSDLLKSLSSEQAVIVMDWAMKFLPMSFREKQSDWFGQKGINWHVSVCIYKSENEELKHRTFAHCVEATKQDWYTVSALLEHTLQTIKSQLPNIKTVFLRSDNAGCYHCGNLWFSIPFISERTGVYIRRYDFSEAQSGKSYCDAKIAHMRGKIRQCVSNGKNVVCASDMKSAIDDYGGVSGCQAAHVEITNILDDHRATGLIKGISKISNIEFQENMQITMWKAYGIGQGRNISVQGQMNSQDESRIDGSQPNISQDISKEQQGWALKKEKKHVRFSDKVKLYLKSIFEDGEKSGNKMNAGTVARNMRVALENGTKMFCNSEYLNACQITSYFSRLAAEKKMPSKCSEDIDSAVALIERFEAIEEITALI
ncbi:uncharacterized protein LOC127732267 [Mytilus californianus]|uniref:uncharacterized protein LOC127732267 n=1 Tax=Mytilus californianus TaxID=6549 RepID=UPI0022480405|nr:uncharacterized protein LOC127732267 [Mytilus californianus]